MIEKKNRIIDASLIEFSKNGYDGASTNSIAKAAKVSKGLIFHYFGSKQELFNYLVEHVMEIFMEKHLSNIEFQSDDFIERLYETYIYKLDIYRSEVPVIEFTKKFLMENNKWKDTVLKAQKDVVTDIYRQLYEDVDVTKIKEGLEMNDIFELSHYIFKGAAEQLMHKGVALKDFTDPKYEEFWVKWINVIRTCVYK